MGTFVIVIIIIAILFYFSSLNEKDKKRKAFNKFLVSKMHQVLESTYLVENTLKHDIFKSRMEFLRQLSADLIASRKNNDYTQCTSSALNIYKSKYYDHVISKLQNDILNDPSIVNQSDFYDEQSILWFKRFCDKMSADIDSLKTNKAKENRREKVLEYSKIVLSEINNNNSTEYHTVISEQLIRFGLN
jgi:hypothetical protein